MMNLWYCCYSGAFTVPRSKNTGAGGKYAALSGKNEVFLFELNIFIKF